MIKYFKTIFLLFLLASCGKADPRIVEGIPKQDAWTIIEQEIYEEPVIAPPPDTFQIQDILLCPYH